MHWADQRPAWLWSPDGSTLLWRNTAARLFNGKLKKHRREARPPRPVPIKGQVARLIRLGCDRPLQPQPRPVPRRRTPVATTCSCTPLALSDGETALLLVGVDPVPADVREGAGELPADAMSEALFPAGQAYRLVGPGTEIRRRDRHQGRPARRNAGVSQQSTASPAQSTRFARKKACRPTIRTRTSTSPTCPSRCCRLALPRSPRLNHRRPRATTGSSRCRRPRPSTGALSSLFDRLVDDTRPLLAAHRRGRELHRGAGAAD